MKTVATLDLEDALRLTEAARKAAALAGVPQNIAVVDHAGGLLSFVRMDRAKTIAADIAINKARTAAGARCATHELTERTLPGEPGYMIQLQDQGRFTTLGGGVPVMAGEAVVGAIGISGGSVAQDVDIAQAAVAAIDVQANSAG